MTDDADNVIASEDEGNVEALGGERLAVARREQQIPLLEIAKELHLDEPKVRALERNEFEVLGAPVFAKGHLRKYAQLVGVAEDDVMADYYQLNRSESAPPIVGKPRKPSREFSPGPWIAAIVLLLAAVVAWWWFVERTPVSVPAATAPVQPAQQPVANEAESSDSSIADAVTPEVVTEETVEDTPVETLAAAVVDDGLMRLTLTYSGDCWTEITDAGGGRLFFDLGRDGRTVNLSGEPPFNVLFGNADNVALRVDDAPFAIPATNRRGRTARLTITGP